MSSKRAAVVITLIDGLGWSLVSQAYFMDKELPCRGPVRTVLGYSSAAIPSLMTGVPPVDHGQWLLFARNVDCDGDLTGYGRIGMLAGQWSGLEAPLRHWLRCWALMRGWPAHFSLFHIPFAEMDGMIFMDRHIGWAPTKIHEVPTFFDYLKQSNIPLRAFGFPSPDRESIRGALEQIAAEKSGVYMLYLWELDSFFHTHYEPDERTFSALTSYNKMLAELLAEAQAKFDPLHFIVVSDHGMTPVKGSVDVDAHLKQHGVLPSSQVRTFYDSTFARFWVTSQPRRNELASALRTVPHTRLLTPEEMRAEGVLFPDSRYGDLFLLMDEGWVVNPSYYGTHPPAGMHGYDPDLPDSMAIFLANFETTIPLDLYQEYYLFMGIFQQLALAGALLHE